MMVTDIDSLAEALEALERGSAARLAAGGPDHMWRAIRFFEQCGRVEINDHLAGTADQIRGRIAVIFGDISLADTDRLFAAGQCDGPDEAPGNAGMVQLEDIRQVKGSALQGNKEG